MAAGYYDPDPLPGRRLLAGRVARSGSRCIRTGAFLRTPDVDPRRWIVQPLIDAGLPSETITDLLFRLGFEAVARPADLDGWVRAVVADQPAAVRAAWVETLSRMIAAAELVS
jgi:hypothetical protein